MALGSDLQQSLAKVIEACLADLEVKLKSIALTSTAGEPEIQRARDFIGQLTSKTVMLDIEEILPKILDYVR